MYSVLYFFPAPLLDCLLSFLLSFGPARSTLFSCLVVTHVRAKEIGGALLVVVSFTLTGGKLPQSCLSVLPFFLFLSFCLACLLACVDVCLLVCLL